MGQPGRWGLALVALLVVAGAPRAGAAPQPQSASLTLSGSGGQSTVLTVGSGGMTVEYPFFTEPRVPGPDGSVSGVVIQRVRDRRVVGGVVQQNAPGFSVAVPMELVDYGPTRLAPGRYRLTILGAGEQVVHLAVRGASAARHVVASGPARPVTRTLATSAGAIDSWAVDLGRTGGSDYVLIAAGSGGDAQQAEDAQMCLQAGSGSPCLNGEGMAFVAPGPGSSAGWSVGIYGPGSLERGPYTFSGHTVGVGPSSTTAHAAVILSLPR